MDAEALEIEIQATTTKLQQLKQQNLFRIRDLLNSYERQDNSNVLRASAKNFHKEVHPTGQYKVYNPADRFLICYYTITGENAANVLKEHLESTAQCRLLPVGDHLDWDETEVEKEVANSTCVVVILSKISLAQSALAFVLECLLQYDTVRPILVHDAATCYFPGPSEIPPKAMPLFGEKAVTFLADYHEAVVEQIVSRYNEQKKAMQNLNVLKSHNHDEVDTNEDVHTRLFLSHRRATAQAIAGKMYEGFKNHYSVFLDSETQFKIHNLEYIVSKTDIFVWILSDGYLTSEWCTKELYAALKNNVKVIIVRDANYKVPEKLSSWENLVPAEKIYELIASAPTLVWMAEYNQHCVEAIRDKYLGATDEVVKEIPKWIERNKLKGFEEKKFDNEKPLRVRKWKFGVADLMVGLKYNYSCTIQCVDLSSLATDDILADLKGLPLTHLVLSHSTVTDDGISKLGAWFPNLRTLDLSHCKNHKSPSLLGLYNLEYLDVSHCFNLAVGVYAPILGSLKNLVFLNVSETFFGDGDFMMICYYLPKLEMVTCSRSSGSFSRNVDEKWKKFVMELNPRLDLEGSLRGYYDVKCKREDLIVKEEEYSHDNHRLFGVSDSEDDDNIDDGPNDHNALLNYFNNQRNVIEDDDDSYDDYDDE